MSDPTRSEKTAPFRPEIEGLRAIAALLVAAFHIWLGRVSGGVDVFIVVSGFLITNGLLGQVERTGAVDFGRFWARLFKRLAPAAMLVLVAVMIASYLWMPTSRWKETIEQLAAAAGYLENWLLAARSVDYLAQHGGVSPVQHYWALSVQGQFYVLWPLLFALALSISRLTRRAFRQVLQMQLLLVFTASLAFSIYLTRHNQPLAYFHTAARAWEFTLGALLALHIGRVKPPATLSFLMGWLGLIAILSCGLVLPVSRIFPGYAALWPTLAAVCLLAAGGRETRFSATRLLSSTPLVYLGGLSYGIYLWHFPLLIFCRIHAAPHEISVPTGMAVILASILLSAATRRFVETPLQARYRAPQRNRRELLFGGALVAPLVAGLALWSVVYLHVRHHQQFHLSAKQTNYPGAAALETGFRYRGEPDVGILPAPLMVSDDREALIGPECDLPPAATVPGFCRLAGTDGAFTVAVAGGSHSSQWLPALQDIAERRGWNLVTYTKSNCPFYFGAVPVAEAEVASCRAWNANVLKELVKLRPDVVFMTSTRFSDDDEFVPEGYVNAWTTLADHGIRVVALRDNPDFEFDVSACVELHGKTADQCSIPRERLLEIPSPVALLTNVPNTVKFIDLSDYFCDRATCPPSVGNVLIYRHMNHITSTYVRTLAPMLERQITDALTPAASGDESGSSLD